MLRKNRKQLYNSNKFEKNTFDFISAELADQGIEDDSALKISDNMSINNFVEGSEGSKRKIVQYKSAIRSDSHGKN